MNAKAKSPVKKTPIKKKTRYVVEEFGINLGQIVREECVNKSIKQYALAKELGISPIGLQHKLNSPTYGTIYDIIKTSKFLKTDLFHMLRIMLLKRGIAVFQGSEEQALSAVAEGQEQYILMKKENELLKELVLIKDKMKKKD
jgi:hypothetical protein